MEISVIASGSNGNCCLVEDKDASVLIDAGKSCREIERRMNALGKSVENVNAIIITHSHHDHITGVGIISRKYGIPLYMTNRVYSQSRHKLGNAKIKFFPSGRSFRIDGMEIRPIKTSHSVASCGFVIGKFGLFTDTGIVTKEMENILPKLKAVLLESNHDIDMLVKGPYPYYLKQWILSDRGHLSNINAGQFIQERGNNLSLALLGHLSGNNNTPKIAKATFDALVKRKMDYHVCSRDDFSGSFFV